MTRERTASYIRIQTLHLTLKQTLWLLRPLRVQGYKSIWLLSAGFVLRFSPVLLEELHSLVLLWVSLHVALQAVHVGGGKVTAAAPVADQSEHIKDFKNRKLPNPSRVATPPSVYLWRFLFWMQLFARLAAMWTITLNLYIWSKRPFVWSLSSKRAFRQVLVERGRHLWGAVWSRRRLEERNGRKTSPCAQRGPAESWRTYKHVCVWTYLSHPHLIPQKALCSLTCTEWIV